MPHQMGKRVWPEDAHYRVTVRATFNQLCDWGHDKGRADAALFLARAGDFLVRYEKDLLKKAERKEARLKRKREAACGPSK
jgi:hypothetical protein